MSSFREFWAGLDSHPGKTGILLRVGNKLYKDENPCISYGYRWVLVLIFLTVYLTSGYLLQYHPASEISPGSFLEGNYTFPLGFLNFSSILFVDNYTGYVGVGSPASSYLLEVSGNFSAEEIYQGGNLVLDTSTSFSGDVTGNYSNLQLGDGVVGSSKVDSSQVQLRIVGSCLSGEFMRVVNEDGTVVCEGEDDSLADVLSRGSVAESSAWLNVSEGSLRLGPGSLNHSYIEFYQEIGGEQRVGWIGYGGVGTTDMSVTNQHAGGIVFRTDDTPRMVIDGEGRIGINTLSPGRTVDVIGELEADTIYQNGNQVLDVGTNFSGDVTGSYNNLQLGSDVVGSNEVNSSEIQLRVSGSCPAGQSIREIYENGSVVCEADDSGITSESDTLSDVLSRGNVAENYVWLNASEGSLKLGPGSQNHSYIEFYQEIGGEQRVGWIGYGGAGTTDLSIVNEMSGGDILFYVHGTSAMKIDNSGNVAIGSSPQSDSRLVVQGDIRLDGASPTYRIKNVDTQSILMSPAYGDLLMNILIPVHCSQMELSCAEAIDYYSQRGDGTTANRNTPVFVKYLPQIYRWYDGGDMLIEYGEMNSIGGVWLCPNLLYPQCT